MRCDVSCLYAGSHIEILFGGGVNMLWTDCSVRIFLDRLSSTKHNFSWTDVSPFNKFVGPSHKLVGGGASPHTLLMFAPACMSSFVYLRRLAPTIGEQMWLDNCPKVPEYR